MSRKSPSEERAFLVDFASRVRSERARRGMSRRLLAEHAAISERYITQIESGRGNISILVLRAIASALAVSPARLLADDATPELARLSAFLTSLTADQLDRAERLLSEHFSGGARRTQQIALIGLRGAGKSTIGRLLAQRMHAPFFELDREIERISGTALASLLDLYGQASYRRYEIEALRELLAANERFVLAAGGGIVSEPATFDLLLRECFTIWLRTTPELHMSRVVAQGDLRPMAGSQKAMDDLRRILDERTPLYARADAELDTTEMSPRGTAERAIALIERAGSMRPGDPEL